MKSSDLSVYFFSHQSQVTRKLDRVFECDDGERGRNLIGTSTASTHSAINRSKCTLITTFLFSSSGRNVYVSPLTVYLFFLKKIRQWVAVSLAELNLLISPHNHGCVLSFSFPLFLETKIPCHVLDYTNGRQNVILCS